MYQSLKITIAGFILKSDGKVFKFDIVGLLWALWKIDDMITIESYLLTILLEEPDAAGYRIVLFFGALGPQGGGEHGAAGSSQSNFGVCSY